MDYIDFILIAGLLYMITYMVVPLVIMKMKGYTLYMDSFIKELIIDKTYVLKPQRFENEGSSIPSVFLKDPISKNGSVLIHQVSFLLHPYIVTICNPYEGEGVYKTYPVWRFTRLSRRLEECFKSINQ